MSWNLRSRKTSAPRFWMVSTAPGPAAVKSCEPILKRVASPSRRSTIRSASTRVSTSSATIRRSLAWVGGCMGASAGPLPARERMVVLLEWLDGDLALEQRLDAADGGLGSVDRGVVGDVQGHRAPADQVGVAAGPSVLRGVEHERDLAALHEGDDVWPVVLVDLVHDLHRHALPLQELGGADCGHH